MPWNPPPRSRACSPSGPDARLGLAGDPGGGEGVPGGRAVRSVGGRARTRLRPCEPRGARRAEDGVPGRKGRARGDAGGGASGSGRSSAAGCCRSSCRPGTGWGTMRRRALPAAGYRVLSGYRGRPEGPLLAPRYPRRSDRLEGRAAVRGRRMRCSARSVAALAARRRAQDLQDLRGPRPTGVLSPPPGARCRGVAVPRRPARMGRRGAGGVLWVRPRDVLPGCAPA